jgi:hypothetical protein
MCAYLLYNITRKHARALQRDDISSTTPYLCHYLQMLLPTSLRHSDPIHPNYSDATELNKHHAVDVHMRCYILTFIKKIMS